MFHWHRYQAIEPLTKGRRVLEIGCGSGYGANFLANTAKSVTAIDVDPSAIADAARLYTATNLVYQCASGLDMPFPTQVFDVVVLFELIEHIKPIEHKRLLEEIRRVMAPGGVLAMSTPDHERTTAMGADNPYHIGELSTSDVDALLHQHFPVVAMYYQDISAASVLWGPSPASRTMQGFAIALTPDGSAPSPVALTSHLPIVALASDEAIPVDLTGFCTETSRRLLLQLWEEIALKSQRLQDLESRLAETHKTVEELKTQHAALWRENHMMAKVITEAENIRAEHDQWAIERPALLQDQAQWQAVSTSRGWQRLKRYWYWLDHSRTGQTILWVKHRAHRKSRP